MCDDDYVGPFSTECVCGDDMRSDWAYNRLCRNNETLRVQLVVLFLLALMVLAGFVVVMKRGRRTLVTISLLLLLGSLSLMAAGAYRLAPHHLSELYPERLLLLHRQARALILLSHVSFILSAASLFFACRRANEEEAEGEELTETTETQTVV